jgi:hypothetical protein
MMERLEDRKHLSLVVDVRLAGGGTNGVISKVGQVINLEVWATATGSNGNSADDGLQDIYGTFYSKNVNGGSALGNITATAVAPFNGSGSGGGTVQDVDGDSDVDLGELNPAVSTGFFLARANGMITTGGTPVTNGQSFHVANLAFTVTKLLGKSGAHTDIIFAPKKTNLASAINAVWREDGVTQASGGINGKGTYTAGSSVVLRQNIGSISGKIWNDKNGDGKRQSTEPGAGVWTVFIDSNKNRQLDTGELSVKSSSGGNYTFANLKGGKYRIRIVPQAKWRKTFPAGSFRDVDLIPGTDSTGRNFGMTTNAVIAGTVFSDANNNGAKDGSESALGGWRVFADLDFDGKYNKKVDVGVLTDANGSFAFTTLPGGKYIIRPAVPTNYRVTTQSKGYVTLKVPAAGTSSSTVFGIHQIA